MFSFVFPAVGSSKNQTGNTLLKCFQFSLLFSSIAAFSRPPPFPLPVAVLPSHGNVNAENTLPSKSLIFFFLYIFIYFDVFIFSFLSSQELSCLQFFANSLTVPWEGLCLCCTFLPAVPDPLGIDFSFPLNSSAACWACQKIWEGKCG